MTGNAPCAFTSPRKSKPFPSGRFTSRIIRSGCSSFRICLASRIFAAHFIPLSCVFSALASPCARALSSSTIKRLILSLIFCLLPVVFSYYTAPFLEYPLFFTSSLITNTVPFLTIVIIPFQKTCLPPQLPHSPGCRQSHQKGALLP